MTPGLAMGRTATTRLWLPFDRGLLTDWGPNAETVTRSGSPSLADGYEQAAMQFRAGQALSIASPSSGLNISAAITFDFWVRSEDGATERAAITRTGAWVISVASSTITAVFTDSGAATYTLTMANPAVYGTGTRWNHWRIWYNGGADMGSLLNGNRVAYSVDVGANLATPGGAITIAGGSFAGRLADIHIRAEADTDPQTAAPNLRVERFTEREFVAVEADLTEDIKAETWTSSGGGWYALMGFDLASLVVAPEDIVSVVGRPAAGADTVFADCARLTDIAAGKYVLVTSHGAPTNQSALNRLYIGTDPAGFAEIWVGIRLRLSDGVGVSAAGRNYLAALVSSDPGVRQFAPWNLPTPTGGGAPVALAAQHPSVPADIASRSATAIRWDGVPSRAWITSDHLGVTALQTHTGFVDAEPEDDGTVVSFQLRHETDRLFLQRVARTIADIATWPNIYPPHSGHQWPRIVGRDHRGVPAVLVDATTNKWKVADPISAEYPTRGLTYLKVLLHSIWPWPVKNVDLRNGTFQLVEAVPGDAVFRCDVGGLGIPTDFTSPTDEEIYQWGDPAEAESDFVEQFKHLLQDLYGPAATSITYGSTFTSTATRVGIWLRYVANVSAANAAAELVRALCRDGHAFYYVRPANAGAVHELEDVVKADAADWTIYDRDVLEESYETDDSQVARRMIAGVVEPDWDYTDADIGTEIAPVQYITRDVRGRLPLASTSGGNDATWQPDQPIKVFNKHALSDWLDVVEPQVVEAARRVRFVLPSRFSEVEQFDVLDIQTTRLPAAAGHRWRVYSVHQRAGAVEVRAFPEGATGELFPADGTSTPGDRQAVRPIVRFSHSDPTAPTLADTAGAWAAVANDAIGWWDDWAPHAACTHRFRVYARRVGGGANADLVFRIRDLTAAATVVETTGTSTSLAWQTVVTSVSLPVADGRLRLEYKTTNGATGVYSDAIWHSSEDVTAVSVADPITPHVHRAVGSTTGLSITGAAADWTDIPDPDGLLYVMCGAEPWAGSTAWRCLVDADPNGATGFEFRPYGGVAATPSVAITVAGRYSFTVPQPLQGIGKAGPGQYKLTSGTPKLHGVAYESVPPYIEIEDTESIPHHVYTLLSWRRADPPTDPRYDPYTYVGGGVWPGTDDADSFFNFVHLTASAEWGMYFDPARPIFDVSVVNEDTGLSVAFGQLFGNQTIGEWVVQMAHGTYPATEARLRLEVTDYLDPGEQAGVSSVQCWVTRNKPWW